MKATLEVTSKNPTAEPSSSVGAWEVYSCLQRGFPAPTKPAIH